MTSDGRLNLDGKARLVLRDPLPPFRPSLGSEFFLFGSSVCARTSWKASPNSRSERRGRFRGRSAAVCRLSLPVCLRASRSRASLWSPALSVGRCPSSRSSSVEGSPCARGAALLVRGWGQMGGVKGAVVTRVRPDGTDRRGRKAASTSRSSQGEVGEARGRRWSQQRAVAGATSAGLTPAPPLTGCVPSACLGLASLILQGRQ